ncbi:zinc finger MYM-type protein 1-like [Olea europaea var. sylvestris]|uniref:zinc finger MYM-type protein 1-like n=1 Tax=Olea europaea var. sylvestris TaxID=158386 RepID=UPI000C1CE09D|nr:zinc finger MYM-type protein 1-like [Olea europaea var. sylvestris]
MAYKLIVRIDCSIGKICLRRVMSAAVGPATDSSRAQELLNNTKKSRAQFNVDDLVSNPGICPPSSHMIQISDVRMAYLKKGPCQPYGHDFPKRPMGNDNRCFRKEWFSKFHWLEYSIEKDAVYCLHCYLFKPDRGDQRGGHIFTKIDFRGWKHKKTLKDHVGLFDSAHNQDFAKCTNLMNQKQSISYVMSSQSSSQQQSYRTWLNAVLDSRCQGIKEVLFSNAPENDQMTSPTIQKDLVNCCAIEMTSVIINEIGDSLFSILVDQARDNSMKEQMVVVLRFVDKSGQVKEHFLGMSHVTNTCAQSLKDVIDAMFSTHGLSISSLRGQGYDRASNMSSESNGLKALILRENPHAMYVHCFAHQLQLAILNIGELTSGSGQFQEMSLGRPSDTRWGSHLLTITRFINMFNAIIDVLENILEDGVHSDKKSSANLRENGCDTLLSRVIEFYVDRHILVPNMEDIVGVKGRPRHIAQQFYPLDFNSEELLLLRLQLDKFLLLVRMDEAFFNLNSISFIAQLLTLALILPVATASVERVFSAMNLIKSDLRNKMGDDWLNENLSTKLRARYLDLGRKALICSKSEKFVGTAFKQDEGY